MTEPQRQFRIRTIDGFTREPLTESQLLDLIRKGKLGPDDEAQRIGSERWRTMSQLAPHMFTAPAAPAAQPSAPSAPQPAGGDDWLADINAVVQESAPVAPRKIDESAIGRGGDDLGWQPDASDFASVAEVPAPRPQRTAPRRKPARAASGSAGAVAGVPAVAWVFAALGGLECLRWLNVLLNAGNPVLLPLPYDFVRTLNTVQVGGVLAVVSQPLLLLAVIPGAMMSAKLIKALPEDERPCSEGQSWFRWTLWYSAPAFSLLLIKVLEGKNLMVPMTAAAASSSWFVLLGLHVAKLAAAVNRRADDAGCGGLTPLGIIAGYMLAGSAAVRTIMVLYSSYYLYSALQGSPMGGPNPSDLDWLLKLAVYAQIASVGLMVGWAIELAVKLPKIGEEAFGS